MSKKILIIEDEQTLVKALMDSLMAVGHEVEVAIDGEQGWQKLQESKPDLVLLDLILPKMDGFTLLSKMKEDEKLKDIPVVVLTNLSDVTDKVMKLGASEYLIKSDHTMKDIEEIIKRKLK